MDFLNKCILNFTKERRNVSLTLARVNKLNELKVRSDCVCDKEVVLFFILRICLYN